MAGEDAGLVGQREQAGVDRVDDLIEVAAGQVGATDTAFKKRVAGDEQLERGKVKETEPCVWPGVCSTCAG